MHTKDERLSPQRRATIFAKKCSDEDSGKEVPLPTQVPRKISRHCLKLREGYFYWFIHVRLLCACVCVQVHVKVSQVLLREFGDS